MNTAAVCEAGSVRRENQDACLVRTGKEEGKRFGLFLVADGMGGHADGACASSAAVKIFDSWWQEGLKRILSASSCDKEIMDRLKAGIQEQITVLNENILSCSRQRQIKTGTTLSILFILNTQGFFAHIGDCRIYKLSGKRLQRLTEDDTMAEVLFKNGAITREEYKRHPGRHVLTKCIGVYPEAVPATGELTISEGDIFFICSDGIHNFITDREICRILRKNRIFDPEKSIKGITKLVKERGAPDNLTGIMVVPGQVKPCTGAIFSKCFFKLPRATMFHSQ